MTAWIRRNGPRDGAQGVCSTYGFGMACVWVLSGAAGAGPACGNDDPPVTDGRAGLAGAARAPGAGGIAEEGQEARNDGCELLAKFKAIYIHEFAAGQVLQRYVILRLH